MNFPKPLQKTFLALLLTLCYHAAAAQVRVEGTVYDRTQRYTMQGVSVLSTSGIGTMTDSLGHYSIRLRLTDSIYFSYLGKVTGKVPVKSIDADSPFDMSLDTPVDTLSTAYVSQRSYRLDSLENRRDYAKIFNYDGSGYLADKRAGNNATAGISLDLDMIWSAKQNKRTDRFREFLERQEQDKYVDHRFTKAIVRKITGLQPPLIDSFMRAWRPSYEFVLGCTTDVELYQYIQRSGRSFMDMWKFDHPSDSTLLAPAVKIAP